MLTRMVFLSRGNKPLIGKKFILIMTELKSKETLVKSILVILIRCTIMTLTPELELEKKVSFKIKKEEPFLSIMTVLNIQELV